MISDTLSNLRQAYAELSDILFTVNFAGTDCFVITSLSSNPFNPSLPIVDVSLVSAETLAPIRMLEQASDTAMFEYATVRLKVTQYLDACLDPHPDLQFPISHNEDAYKKYLSTLG